MINYHYLPTRIWVGFNVINELGNVVKSYGRRALLLFSRSFARRYGYIDKLGKILKDAGISFKVYEGILPNPPSTQCNNVALKIRDFDTDVIVAFGGGSVIDAAKAVSVVLSLGGKVEDYFYPNIVTEEVLPVIAIPTTCGTGSEVTKYALITDVVKKRKAVIVGETIIPRVALVDPQVLKHLPRNLLTWTVLDAFSHAIEAYMSKSANDFSDMFGLRALELIMEALSSDLKLSDDKLLKLHLASTLAGMAINIAGTTLIHALGYYLTTHHDVHHGLSNALVMPYVLARNIKAISDVKIRRLMSLLHVGNVKGIIRRVCEMLDKLEIPNSIGDVGVKISEVNDYVKEVINYRRNLDNNPITVNEELIKDLIIEALRGRKEFMKRF